MDVQENTRGVAGSIPSHPSLDVLIDYYHDRLAPAKSEPIQQHLTRCRRCTTLLLDLEDFAIAEEKPPSPREIAEARSLTKEIFLQLHADRWRNAALLAASLLVATTLPLGIFYKNHNREETRNVAAEPSTEINVPITSLYPRSSLRGGSKVNRFEIPRSAKFIVIVLATEDLPGSSVYELQLVVSDMADHELFSLRGLQPTPVGTFSLGLPTSLLPPGKYLLKLKGIQKGRQMDIDEYPLEVVLLGQSPPQLATPKQDAQPR